MQEHYMCQSLGIEDPQSLWKARAEITSDFLLIRNNPSMMDLPCAWRGLVCLYRLVFLHPAVTQNRLARWFFLLYFCTLGKIFMPESEIYAKLSSPVWLLEQSSAYAWVFAGQGHLNSVWWSVSVSETDLSLAWFSASLIQLIESPYHKESNPWY